MSHPANVTSNVENAAFVPHDFAEPRKNRFEVLVRRVGVQLAYEQHVVRWRDVSVGQVSHLSFSTTTTGAGNTTGPRIDPAVEHIHRSAAVGVGVVLVVVSGVNRE